MSAVPVKRCPNCNYVIIDAATPCSSCGNMYVDPDQPSVASRDFSNFSIPLFPASTEFSVGTVISRSFTTFSKHFLVFIGLCLLSQIPGFFATLLLEEMIADIISLAFIMVIQGAVSYGVYQAFLGKPVLFSDSLSRGMECIISLTLAIMLFGLAFSVLYIGVVIVVAFVIGILWLIGLAFIAPVLPPLAFVYVWSQWFLFAPACAVERLGPVECLQRSAQLTNGTRLQLSGIILSGGAIIFGIAFAGAIVTVWLPPVVFALSRMLTLSVIMAFYNVLTAVTYYELRSVREGISVESLANVFD